MLKGGNLMLCMLPQPTSSNVVKLSSFFLNLNTFQHLATPHDTANNFNAFIILAKAIITVDYVA